MLAVIEEECLTRMLKLKFIINKCFGMFKSKMHCVRNAFTHNFKNLKREFYIYICTYIQYIYIQYIYKFTRMSNLSVNRYDRERVKSYHNI